MRSWLVKNELLGLALTSTFARKDIGAPQKSGVLGGWELMMRSLIDESTARKGFLGLKPHLRSGLDLPPLLPTEVEIARLRLAETIHEEVTSIRARRVGGRIAYRIAAEVLSSEGYRLESRPLSSSKPLTLGKLIDMIDNTQIVGPDGEVFPRGLVISAWEHQVTECENTDPESLRNWIAVSSAFYPDLKAYYQQVFVQWALGSDLIQPDGKQAQH